MSQSLWRSVKMIGWSFFGVRKSSESKEDVAQVNPFHIIVAGIAGAVIFVAGLVVLVNWVVAK
jgi:hypothetical protein